MRQTLIAVEQAEKTWRRLAEIKCDWADTEDINEYYRDRTKEQRERLLDKHVPERVCPNCRRKYYFAPRVWVRSRGSVICRSCFMVLSHAKGIGELKKVLTPLVRYKLDGQQLKNCREMVGMSQRVFAERVGWTYSYQAKLETGSTITISEESGGLIRQVLIEAMERLFG